jgi:exosortase/archaeosortase family protein
MQKHIVFCQGLVDGLQECKLAFACNGCVALLHTLKGLHNYSEMDSLKKIIVKPNLPIGLLLVQLLAFWPVWKWYVCQLFDPVEEPCVVIALVTALGLIMFNKSEPPPEKRRLLVPTILLLAYAATFHILAPLPRAALAMTTLSWTLSVCYPGRVPQPGILGLLLLSLPIIPTMQLYLSYPFRVAIGKLSAMALQLIGFPVTLEGIALQWRGELIWLDVLCSGVRKFWAGLYLICTLAALYKLTVKKTLAVTGFAIVILLGTNIVRTMALFYVKTDILALPWWIHKGGYLMAFLAAAILIVWFTRKLEKRT